MDKKELWGIRLELLGLIALLIGGFWQAKFSGWWDQELPEWQSWIQENVNFAILSSLDNIAAIEIIEDKKLRESLAEDVRKRVYQTISDSITKRDNRKAAMDKGQASVFWNVRDFFLILGALFLVVGKWLSLQGVKSRTLK